MVGVNEEQKSIAVKMLLEAQAVLDANFSKADFMSSKTNRIMKLKESKILND